MRSPLTMQSLLLSKIGTKERGEKSDEHSGIKRGVVREVYRGKGLIRPNKLTLLVLVSTSLKIGAVIRILFYDISF